MFSKIVLRFNAMSGLDAQDFYLPLRTKNALVCTHPDQDVDVAVALINVDHLRGQGMQVAFFGNDQHTADIAAMTSRGITEGDFAYVLGFPMGLVGPHRNTVIVRSGSIARIRDTLGGFNKEFLVDARYSQVTVVVPKS